MTDDSFYQRHRLDFIHRHRIDVSFRRRVAAELWTAAAALFAAAVAVRWAVTDALDPLLVVVMAVVVVGCVAALRRPAPAPHAHGLPGVPDGPCPAPPPPELGPWVIGSRFAGPLALVTFATGAPWWVVLVPTIAALVLSGRVVVFALGVRRRTQAIARALAAHEPRFAIAYAGYGGGPTHLTMWEEPLLSAGFPGVVFNYRSIYCE
ncbi:MAG: hypothetical protein ABW075_10125, partial [Aeromicrobium sp.]